MCASEKQHKPWTFTAWPIYTSFTSNSTLWAATAETGTAWTGKVYLMTLLSYLVLQNHTASLSLTHPAALPAT